MSAAVMTIQHRTWNGARALLAALAVAVAVLISLLVITNNDGGASSSPTRSVTPVGGRQAIRSASRCRCAFAPACSTGSPIPTRRSRR
jgi:hypothetical protein